jgi:hypothetical protein
MRRALATAVILTVVATSLRAGAQPDVECEVRARALAARLDDEARATRTWYWAWMAAGTALIVGQGTGAVFATGDLRKELVVGASASVFIPGLLLVHPPLVLHDARALHEQVKLGEPCLVLPAAAQRVVRDAKDQALATGWFAHTFIIGGNFALGLLLGVGLHDWVGGAKQLVGGTLIGELQILTLPTGVLRMQGLGLAGTF